MHRHVTLSVLAAFVVAAPLAWTSHHGAAARPDLPASAALRSVELLAVATATAAGPLGRDALHPRAASAVRSSRGEKSRLAAAEWAITSVRLFDGADVVENATVLVIDGRIAAVGSDLELPAGVETLDGRGRTLLPGFIDSHTHSWGDALERAAVFGVTTTLDMFTEPGFAATAREQQLTGGAAGRADLVSAGFLATAPGGHGTQYGMPVPTLTTADEAPAWVAARIGEGSDFIKIVLEDGSGFGRPLPTLDAPTAAALVVAAHQHGKLAVAHATTFELASVALGAGVDGLVHLFRDREGSAEWVAEAARRGVFVVPTLTVVEGTMGVPSGAGLIDDPRLAPWLRENERDNLRAAFPAHRDVSLEPAYATLRALAAAGVPILAGSDAPNPGTSFGVSLHRELELLVAAGLSPRAALTAATATPAAAFGLADRGRVVSGLRADLLLVEGNPLTDVTATRAIVGVWKEGVAVPRPKPEATPASVPLPTGRIADFEAGELTADFGFGWSDSTDAMLGGKSTVAVEVVEGGAGESARALLLRGEIVPGFAFPWAGAMYFPGASPMAPADLSAATEVVFWAKGTPGTYRLLCFARSLGQIPSQQTFEVGEEWRRFAVPLAGFSGLDAAGLTGLLWTAGPAPGVFELTLDDIELR
jgi:imidazolonepropionase-like amidohydrolase